MKGSIDKRESIGKTDIGKEIQIIKILGSSQGTIAVVAALLAGFCHSLSGTISPGVLQKHSWVGYLFRVSTALVVAGNLFVALICSISEQQAQVAQAMSLVRDSPEYNRRIEDWWRKFSVLRTNAIWAFFFSIPLFFISLACESYLFCGEGYIGSLGAVIFGACGVYTYVCIDYMNKLFRKEVLMIDAVFRAPQYSSKTKHVSSRKESFDQTDPTEDIIEIDDYTSMKEKGS